MKTVKRVFWTSAFLSLILSQTSQEWFFLTATIAHLGGILVLSERIKNPIAKRLCCILFLGLAPFTIGILNGAGEGISEVANGGVKSILLSYQRIGEEVWKVPTIVKVVKNRDIGLLAEILSIPIVLLGVAGIILLAILLLVDIPRNIVFSLKERGYKGENRIE